MDPPEKLNDLKRLDTGPLKRKADSIQAQSGPTDAKRKCHGAIPKWNQNPLFTSPPSSPLNRGLGQQAKAVDRDQSQRTLLSRLRSDLGTEDEITKTLPAPTMIPSSSNLSHFFFPFLKQNDLNTGPLKRKADSSQCTNPHYQDSSPPLPLDRTEQSGPSDAKRKCHGVIPNWNQDPLFASPSSSPLNRGLGQQAKALDKPQRTLLSRLKPNLGTKDEITKTLQALTDSLPAPIPSSSKSSDCIFPFLVHPLMRSSMSGRRSVGEINCGTDHEEVFEHRGSDCRTNWNSKPKPSIFGAKKKEYELKRAVNFNPSAHEPLLAPREYAAAEALRDSCEDFHHDGKNVTNDSNTECFLTNNDATFESGLMVHCTCAETQCSELSSSYDDSDCDDNNNDYDVDDDDDYDDGDDYHDCVDYVDAADDGDNYDDDDNYQDCIDYAIDDGDNYDDDTDYQDSVNYMLMQLTMVPDGGFLSWL